MNTENWKIWKNYLSYGELSYKRALGEEAEMECSKAICQIISRFYSSDMTILDAACACGHYLYSLKKRVDSSIKYYGIDFTECYIDLAKQAFPDHHFVLGDIYNLQFQDNSFDIVMCNNTIPVLPAPPIKAIQELTRVSRQYVIIRTLFGEANYIIKWLHPQEGEFRSEKELISLSGEVESYQFLNMYTEQYYREIIREIDPHLEINIESDMSWQSFDNQKVVGPVATKVVNGKQICGNFILDWRFIILKKQI